jgi:hypothetical protein
MDKTNAINQLIQSREKLHRIISEIPSREIDARKLEGSWNAKDILGHITAWDITLLNPLKKLASDGSFVPEEIPDGERYNLQQAEIRRDRELSVIIEELEQVRQEILKIGKQLPEQYFERIYPAPWGGEDTLAGMINGLAWHENEHLESILKLKANITK